MRRIFRLLNLETPIHLFSDLHLGHPACRISSVEQLRPLFEGAMTVVFNGDTVEQRHSSLIPEANRLLGELTALVESAGATPIFLRGNHDPDISEVDWLDLEAHGVFLTHGDVLFRHLSPWNPKIWSVIPDMEKIRTDLGAEAIDSDLETALKYTQHCRLLAEGDEHQVDYRRFKRLHSAWRLIWPPKRPFEILKCWTQVPQLSHSFVETHRPEASFFLFGHSHRPGIWKRSGRTLINTGGFLSMGTAQAVVITDGSLEVRKIDESAGAIRLGQSVFSASTARS